MVAIASSLLLASSVLHPGAAVAESTATAPTGRGAAPPATGDGGAQRPPAQAAPTDASGPAGASGASSGPVVAALLPYATTTTNMEEGTTVGFLNVVYNGHGFVEMRADGLHLSPRVAAGPVLNGGAYGYDTHAALVTADAGLLGSSYTLRLSMRTIEQLRQDGPAPWERAWLLFDYADSLNYSYVILKANGWEIGRVTNGVQSFDATGNDPRFTVGGADELTILRTTEHLTVVVNDVALFDTVLTGARPMSYRSAVYTEDAHIRVDQWSISNAPLRTAASTSPGTGITQPRVAAPAA